MEESHNPPEKWTARRKRVTAVWSVPFHRVQWLCEWISYGLGKVALIQVLEYVGKLSLLGALLTYIWTIPERRQAVNDARKAKHYTAWQALNSAVGKPGDGGRAEALQDLNRDGVSLDGLDLSGGAVFVTPLSLTNARMGRAKLDGAYFVGGDFAGAKLRFANMNSITCLQGSFANAVLWGAKLTNADFQGCDFSGADLRATVLVRAQVHRCSFAHCDFGGSVWKDAAFSDCNFAFANLAGARVDLDPRAFIRCNLYGVTNAPPSFLKWATNTGTVFVPMTNHAAWLAWVTNASASLPSTRP